MASSMAKKVNVRFQRCMDQLLALRHDCTGPQDARNLEAAVFIVRDAMAKAADVFHGLTDAAAAVANQPVRAPAQIAPPAAPPAAPGKPAPHKTPATIEVEPRRLPGILKSEHPRVQRDIDDVLSGGCTPEFVVLPDDMSDGEFVDYCLADMVGAYVNAAAKILAKQGKSAWDLMDDSERRKAIDAKAAQIEADDDDSEDYLERLVNGVVF